MKHLHLQDFKKLYKALKTPIPYVNWLILGFLVYLEQKYIHIKVNTEIDNAIDDYHRQMDRLKKWHNFEKPIGVTAGTHSPPAASILLYILDSFLLPTE